MLIESILMFIKTGFTYHYLFYIWNKQTKFCEKANLCEKVI